MSWYRVLATLLLGWVLWLNVQDRWLIVTSHETEAECRKATDDDEDYRDGPHRVRIGSRQDGLDSD